MSVQKNKLAKVGLLLVLGAELIVPVVPVEVAEFSKCYKAMYMTMYGKRH